MKVMLVGPKWNKLVNSYPSLGLAYVAAVLEQEGHEVKVVDMGLRPSMPVEEEMQQVFAFAPDLVGFTSMSTSHHSVERAARLVKQQLGCTTVIGGPHATTLPEMTLANPDFDFLVVGEGEETIRQLVRVLARGERSWQSIAGLGYKTGDGQVRVNPAGPLIEDLDSLPFPARHLFDIAAYPLFDPTGQRMITVLSSRGCPYDCSFCYKGIVGRTYRHRSPDNVIAELSECIQRYNVRSFYFIDDLFTIDVHRLDEFCDRVLAVGLDIRWQCLARVDRVTLPILKKMYRAGCREVHYGIESGNSDVLKATAKHIDLSQVRQAIAWTDESGIRGKGYFMLGLPGDNDQTIEDTIAFAESLSLEEAMFSIATPFPGTRLWDQLVRKQPQTAYDADFTRAYYYNSYTAEIAPFLNVSDVSDQRLSTLAIEARRRVQQAKKRRTLQKKLGPRLGALAWRVTRPEPVRKIGRRLLALPGMARLRSTLLGSNKQWV
jgi:anaerobic magnesium-protoporphyrin IX monomethyl ester cyclase